jgi:hypothetical protein
MEAKDSSKTSATTYKITRHHNPEDNQNGHIHENLKSRSYQFVMKFPFTVTQGSLRFSQNPILGSHTKKTNPGKTLILDFSTIYSTIILPYTPWSY